MQTVNFIHLLLYNFQKNFIYKVGNVTSVMFLYFQVYFMRLLNVSIIIQLIILFNYKIFKQTHVPLYSVIQYAFILLMFISSCHLERMVKIICTEPRIIRDLNVHTIYTRIS